MRQPVLRVLLWLALAAATLAGVPAAAAPPSADDSRAVRAVVEAQLAALAAGDAARAFSYASPSIRSQFGDAGRFVGMVRQGYPMVIRPQRTAFFVPEAAADGEPGTVLQRVQLRDAAGRAWLATYQVQRQPDRSWRINGCAVEPDDEKSGT